jgi:methylmalonyl-CoA mutase N-terminal domain/subunit
LCFIAFDQIFLATLPITEYSGSIPLLKKNDKLGAQMLKYHIQTSGRSLHAQEIDFNDIRTTLQALYAIYDNCNSLHTNAYDEAITTPTEESVRRAMAIQLIIN